MRQVLLVVIGVAATVAGVVWTLQGLGYVGGSFMSGATVWAVIGPVVALAGLVLVAAGSRRRRRNP
jgi:MYXO-CTERM domain-containing protein